VSAALVRRCGGLAAALVLLWAHGVAAVGPPSPPAADPVAGAALFRTRGCVACHAQDVTRFQERRLPLYALAAAMWNHLPHMAEQIRTSRGSRPYFTSGEMRDLVAFLYAGDASTVARLEAQLVGDAGNPGRGRQLVTDKGCLGCHSISGAPGKHAGRLEDLKGLETPWSVVAQMWNHSFLMQLEAQAGGTTWPSVSADEMADLVAFLQSLMRAR
jgi:cytochrome c551/c552